MNRTMAEAKAHYAASLGHGVHFVSETTIKQRFPDLSGTPTL